MIYYSVIPAERTNKWGALVTISNFWILNPKVECGIQEAMLKKEIDKHVDKSKMFLKMERAYISEDSPEKQNQ